MEELKLCQECCDFFGVGFRFETSLKSKICDICNSKTFVNKYYESDIRNSNKVKRIKFLISLSISN
ncbi:MAG: hypothetical protein ACTSPQ_15080 [Candidatus Helarchaeota archaeon]